MRIALLVCAAFIPVLAAADDSRPYVTHNGHGVEASAPSSNQAAAPAAPAAAFGTGTARPGVVTAAEAAAAGAMAAVPAASGQAVVGRSSNGKRGIAKRRGVPATGGAGGAGSTGGTGSTQAPPPNFSKPGALIRTAGQLPVYSDPGNARTTSVEGGGLITIDQSKAHDAARSNGLTYGAPDTRPTVNPNSGTGAGGSAVTSNGGPTTSATTNGGGSSGGATTGGANNGDSGGGNGNTGGNGGGKSKDSSTPPTGTGFDGSF